MRGCRVSVTFKGTADMSTLELLRQVSCDLGGDGPRGKIGEELVEALLPHGSLGIVASNRPDLVVSRVWHA